MWYTEFAFAAAAQVLAGAGMSTALRRLRHVPQPQGLPGRALPLLETAFLAGGPPRVVDAVIVRMQQEGRLIVSRSGWVTITDRSPRDAVEAVLITSAGSYGRAELSTLRREMVRSQHIQRIGDGLADRGLMRRPELYRKAMTARKVLWFAQLAVIVLGAMAAFDWAGLSISEQGTRVPPFFPFLGLLLVGLFWLAATRPERARISPAGVRQLELMRTGARPWEPHDLALVGGGAMLGMLALDGVYSLQDEELRAALMTRPLTTSSSSGSSSSGDSGSPAVWCSSGDSGSSSSCGSSGSSSCGSSGSSGGGSSSSCGGGGGSSCGGGGGCGS